MERTPKPLEGLSTLPVRLATAAVYAGTFVAAIIWGGPFGVAVVCAVLAGGATYEFARISRGGGPGAGSDLIAIAGSIAAPYAAALGGLPELAVVVVAALVLVVARHIVLHESPLASAASSMFGIVYIGFAISHLVLVRALEAGMVLALTLLVSVWANDVFAYLAGSTMGRHKMSPRISPNKSWEGFAAGTLAGVAVWVTAGLIAETGLDLPSRAIIGLILAVVAVGGDLFESRIKREAGVKDTGTALPGHGGFLDRIDSLIAVSVVGYYLLLAATAFGGVL